MWEIRELSSAKWKKNMQHKGGKGYSLKVESKAVINVKFIIVHGGGRHWLELNSEKRDGVIFCSSNWLD